MGSCVHFSRSLPSNSWWQTMAGWQVLSRPPAAEGGGRQASLYRTCHPAILGHRGRRLATAQPGVSKPGRSTLMIVARASRTILLGSSEILFERPQHWFALVEHQATNRGYAFDAMGRIGHLSSNDEIISLTGEYQFVATGRK